MAFEKFVCWHKEAVDRYLNIEAVRDDDDAAFLATHHPVKMTRHVLRDEVLRDVPEDRTPYPEGELLREFLDPPEVCRVAVLGETGTGKSHLVRWLAASLPRTPDRETLLIRREGSNLRSILESILKLPDLEGEEVRRWRHRLHQAASGLTTPEQAAYKLLYNLAVACGPDGPHNNQNLSPAQQDLVPGIRDFLTHPILTPYFTRPGGVLRQLVANTLGLGEARPGEVVEEHRGFTVKDLPALPLAEVKQLNEQVRRFYNTLSATPGLREAAVSWMNQQLNSTAIAELLELKGDELFKMMRGVRRLLRRANGGRGRELVLLIEDLARMQGVDKQLLDALAVPPSAELCRMRVALGCTTGYYRGLPETAQGRFDFFVRLDLKAAGRMSMTPEEAAQFVARYLNAVRLKDGALDDWHRRREAGADDPPPSACEHCPHNEGDDRPCHAAFGSRDGYGLYPLTRTAIGRMLQRVCPAGFNPREVINRLLKEVLRKRKDLKEGKFPPPTLHEHLGGSKLPTAVNGDLNRREPNVELRKRRAALLDLWSDGTRVVNLDPRLHRAFALPLLPDAVAADEGLRGVEEPMRPGPEPEDNGLPAEVRERLEALDRWQNNHPPPNKLLQDVRDLVFAALRQHIDWDTLPLLPKLAFSSESRLFRKRSLLLDGQQQDAARGFRVELKLPLTGQERTDAAMALQALVLFDHHGHWRFPSGHTLARRLATELDRWAAHVLAQFRAPDEEGAAWDPTPAAAEVLALTAALAGRPPGPSPADRIDALFAPDALDAAAGRCQAWQELFRELSDRQKELQELLRSHVPCTRGGSSVVKVVDPSRFAAVLDRADPRPTEDVPDKLWETYRAVAEARQAVDRGLDRVVAAEKERYREWLAEVRASIGEGQTAGQVVDAVSRAVDRAHRESVLGVESIRPLHEAGDRFRAAGFDVCVAAVEAALGTAEPAALLAALAVNRREPMDAAAAFLREAERFLAATKRRVEEEGAGQRRNGPATAADDIGRELDALHDTLEAEAGGGL